jgi:type IX secretion system PorP/SprF family membrane protein
MKKIILILYSFLSLYSFDIKSQDIPVHEQFLFNYTLINPAFNGLAEITTVKLSHRQQWIGFGDAPFTSFLAAKHKFKYREGGIGGYIFSDRNGPNSRYGIQLSGSFKITLKQIRNKKQVLAFGMSFKGLYHILDETNFNKDIYDPLINYTQQSSFIPNANFGMIYATNNSFIGFSLENLIPYTDKIYKQSVEPPERIFLNAHAGSILQFNYGRQLRPSIIYRTNFKGESQMDAMLRFHFMFSSKFKSSFDMSTDEFWIGVLYRQTLDRSNKSPLSIAPAFGVTFGSLTFTYSYDLGLTSLQRYNYGTHQVAIGIKILHNENINWDRKNPMLFLDEF